MSIKIQFTDFWNGVDPADNYFYNHLSSAFDVELSDKPDILFYSCFGKEYLKYKCTRIFYTGENRGTDFTGCDYAIGFDYTKNPDYLRLPLYLLYLKNGLSDLVKPPDIDPDSILAGKTGFCNMVISNKYGKKRNNFFHALSEYKQVTSGGKHLNNIGGPLGGEGIDRGQLIFNNVKRAFIKKFKFTLSFENSSYPGYTTEKLIEPMLENSIPIYWGNPVVKKDFNSASFLNYHDYNSNKKLIDRIIEVDNNDELYKEYIRQPFLPGNLINPDLTPTAFINFMHKVFRELHLKPVAKRKPLLHFINRKIVTKAKRKLQMMLMLLFIIVCNIGAWCI